MLSDLLPHVCRLSPQAAARVVAGARAVAATTQDDVARDGLVLSLLRLEQVPATEVFDVAGPAPWGPLTRKGLFGRGDLDQAAAKTVLRTITTKRARREGAEHVRSLALATELVDTADWPTGIALVGNYNLPGVWRGELAADLDKDIASNERRLRGLLAKAMGHLPEDGVFALLERLSTPTDRLRIMRTEGVLVGRSAWTRAAKMLAADPDGYRASLGGTQGQPGVLRDRGAMHQVLTNIAATTDQDTRRQLLSAYKPVLLVGNGDPLEKLLRLPVPAEAADPQLVDWRQVIHGMFGGMSAVDVLTLLDSSLGEDPSKWVTLAAIGDEMRGPTGEVLSAVRAAVNS